MIKRLFSFGLILALVTTSAPVCFAQWREAGASLVLPTTGQAMNGEIGNGKTKAMAIVEAASITAITVLGFTTGGAALLLFGVTPLAVNHVWSATDAYRVAKTKDAGMMAPDQEMVDAQRNLELSRQQRFEREQIYRSDLRERVRQAGEQAYYG